eukprot:scaffold8784_cov151-Skeletonema_dohrnii-CCMP3373.AAC.2
MSFTEAHEVRSGGSKKDTKSSVLFPRNTFLCRKFVGRLYDRGALEKSGDSLRHQTGNSAL